ncbi:DUF2490 domain-containing protein [Sediminicola luteus]|uniref:DUF2490 domain-containing protein n=1 Tax=Sediminicola luteus TaxID=319238 RepID=A0ABV2TRD7_9FLAO
MNRLAALHLLLLLAILPLTIRAQKTVEYQDQLWTRYFLKIKIDPKWQILQEVEERVYLSTWRQHQFVSRTQLERNLGKGYHFGIGFTYSEQATPQDPTIKDFTNQTELRPQLALEYNQHLSKKFTINHRYWTEFRYFERNNGSFEFANNRSRYKLELRNTSLNHITLKAYNEILLNIGGNIIHNVFDQNRYGTSIQYMPLENLGIEIGYLNSFQQRKSGVDFYNRNIVRLTVYHTIKYKPANIP